MMDIEQNDSRQKIPEELLDDLQQQLEFYLSEANLFTDQRMVNQLAKHKDREGIHISYFLKCRKIQEKFGKYWALKYQKKKRIIKKAATRSIKLRMRQNRIARKKKMNFKTMKSRFLYLESANINNLVKQINDFQIQDEKKSLNYSCKIQNNWAFLIFSSRKKKKNIQNQLKQLVEKFQISRIHDGFEWLALRNKFLEIRKNLRASLAKKN